MPFDADSLRTQIKEAKAVIAAGEAAKGLLPHLENALAAIEAKEGAATSSKFHHNKKSSPIKKSASTGDFEPKYGKSAGKLAEDVVREAGHALTLRQIQDALAAQGKELSDQAVAVGIKSNPALRRASAPKDSASKYAYKLVE